jgi:hypothetical protein
MNSVWFWLSQSDGDDRMQAAYVLGRGLIAQRQEEHVQEEACQEHRDKQDHTSLWQTEVLAASTLRLLALSAEETERLGLVASFMNGALAASDELAAESWIRRTTQTVTVGPYTVALACPELPRLWRERWLECATECILQAKAQRVILSGERHLAEELQGALLDLGIAVLGSGTAEPRTETSSAKRARLSDRIRRWWRG